MKAYKFLAAGAVGPFSGLAWPVPGDDGGPGPWVHVGTNGDGPVLCRRGVHGCTAGHLPWWLQDELWEVELAEPVRLVRHKLVAPAGRLLRRVDGWDAACAAAFAADCASRVTDPAITPDAQGAARAGDAAVSGYIAAHAMRRQAGPEAMDAERARQAAWLVQRLGLDAR